MSCNKIQAAVITPVLAAGSVASPYFYEVNITQRLCYPTCADNTPVFNPQFSLKSLSQVGTGRYVATIHVEGIISYIPCNGGCGCTKQQPLSQYFTIPIQSASAPTVTIEQEAAKKDLVMPILLEVNVAEEESKFGLTTNEVLPLLEKISIFSHIKVMGLMTIAPFVKNPEENREIFRTLKKLSVDINAKNINNVNMSVLSMGMTGDYQVAVQEGSTMVRVGTGIFGERNYATRQED